MVAFFKHDIQSWRGGTYSLTSDQYRVYHFIVEQIMMEEGPVQVHERAYSGGCAMSVRLFRKTLSELVETGKLFLENGRVSNSRAEKEIEFVKNHRENSKTGGKKSGNTRREGRFTNEKANDFNADREVPLRRDTNIYRGREEVEREKEKKDSPLPPSGGRDRDLSDEEIAEIRSRRRARFEADDDSDDQPAQDTSRPIRRERRNVWPEGWFETFWSRYPKKEGKKESLAILDGIRKKDDTSFESIMDGLARYLKTQTDIQFIMQPARWLRNARWTDEGSTQVEKPQATMASRRRSAI